MALSTSNSRSGVNMGSSAGYTGYPGPHPSGGVPGLGIPPPVPNLSDYRNAPHQPHLMSHPLHSLPTPQPQPLGLPVPSTKIHNSRTVPFHSQGTSNSYSNIAAKDIHGQGFSQQANFSTQNRSHLHSSQPPYPIHQGGQPTINWRDHLTPNISSPNSLPQNVAFNSFPGNPPLPTSVPRPSSSLSSSSDQRSIGSGNRYPAPPPKPPKPQHHSYSTPKVNTAKKAVPNTNFISTQNDTNEDEEESDWEREISEQGDVFYVVPYISSDQTLAQNRQISSEGPNQTTKQKDFDISASVDKNGKKLSRLVRRRESKRDRGNSGGNGVSPKMSDHSKMMERLDFAGDDAVDANHKSISLLPGGFKSSPSMGPQQNNNSNHDSSDNDSSTYGQIKTFEEFVEGGGVINNMDLGNKPKKKMSTSALKYPGSSSPFGGGKHDSSDEDPASITELHEVSLKINVKQLKPQLPHFRMALDSDNPTHSGILLDAILGIAAAKRDEGELGVIVVRGYVPNRSGAAMKAGDRGELLIGDIIRSMDGQHVTMDTVNSFLVQKLTNCSSSQKTTTVKLTIQRPIVKLRVSQGLHVENSRLPGVEEIDDENNVKENQDQSESELSSYIKMIHGDGLQPSDIQEMLGQLPHLLLYATTSGTTEAEEESADVLYTYPSDTPNNPQSTSYRLYKSRGVFVTLCQLLGQVTGDGEKPNVTSVLLDGNGEESGGGSVFESQLVHIGYEEENGEVLLLALPASKYSSKDTYEVLKNFARIIRLQFGGTLSKAFKQNTDVNKETDSSANTFLKNKELDKLISSLFLNILIDTSFLKDNRFPTVEELNQMSTSKPSIEETLQPVSQWLLLPVDIQFQVEDAINQLESADFRAYSGDLDNDETDDFYDAPREFHILGSCLFHRGLLVSSHLSKIDTTDVLLWLKANRNILSLSSKYPVRRIVAWKEIFPTKLQKRNKDGKEKDKNDRFSTPLEGTYSSQQDSSRVFLLVVGLGYQLLAVMVENGVGGCSESPEDMSEHPLPIRPDPFYVDQAASTLEHLEEMGIPIVCERWLTLPSNPDVLDIDQFYQKVVTKNKKVDGNSSQSTLTGAGTGGIVLRRTKSVDHMKEEQLSITSSEESELNRRRMHQKGIETESIRHQRESSCSTSEYSEEMQTAFRGDDAEENTSEKKAAKDTEEESKSESLWEVPKSGVRPRHNYALNSSGSTRDIQSNLNISHEGKSSISSATSSYKRYLDQQMASSNSYKASDVNEEEDNAEFVTYRISQLSISFETTIFHYCHLNVGQGVYLAPLKTSCDSVIGNNLPGKGDGPLHKQFLANFQSACQIIHSTFKLSQRNRIVGNTTNSTTDINHPPPKPWKNTALVAIKEQAMLFHWTPTATFSYNKKGSNHQSVHHLPTLSYWVCGRVFDSSVVSISSGGATSSTPSDITECYVAYHDSAPQNMIELAFRIAFGVHV